MLLHCIEGTQAFCLAFLWLCLDNVLHLQNLNASLKPVITCDCKVGRRGLMRLEESALGNALMCDG